MPIVRHLNEQDTSYLDQRRYLALVSVFEVNWVDGESIHGEAGVLEPHGGAVKVDQHPFVGIEIEGVSQLDAIEKRSELGTNEGGSCIGCIHMQPKTKLLADRTNLLKVVKCT